MKTCFALFLTGLALLTTAAAADQRAYELPEETADFKQGPGVEVARANCTACHSADYISTQPHGPGFGRKFWQAEVTKMQKTFGAPISDEDADKIVDYLDITYRSGAE